MNDKELHDIANFPRRRRDGAGRRYGKPSGGRVVPPDLRPRPAGAWLDAALDGLLCLAGLTLWLAALWLANTVVFAS